MVGMNPCTRKNLSVFALFACHEANYAVPNILSGVRAAERRGRR